MSQGATHLTGWYSSLFHQIRQHVFFFIYFFMLAGACHRCQFLPCLPAPNTSNTMTILQSVIFLLHAIITLVVIDFSTQFLQYYLTSALLTQVQTEVCICCHVMLNQWDAWSCLELNHSWIYRTIIDKYCYTDVKLHIQTEDVANISHRWLTVPLRAVRTQGKYRKTEDFQSWT